MRDMDLIRDILLATENNCEADSFYTFEDGLFAGFTEKEIYMHSDLLFKKGFLRKTPQTLGYSVCVSGLTWEGYDFLDSVRDPEIWRKTKAAGEKVGGWTVGILADYAKGLIKLQFDNMLSGAAS